MESLRHITTEAIGAWSGRIDQLFLAFVLSSLIGLEREIRLKSAGLRTHALVGLGSALFMLVSKFGFSDVLGPEFMRLDPSRVAAQIVSGIGFIGAGLIFVRKDIVHGLTTAATIWLTAGVGMACGGSLPLLAVAATLAHFVVVFGYRVVMQHFVGRVTRLTVQYAIRDGVSKNILALCASEGFTLRSFAIKTEYRDHKIGIMTIRLQGSKPVIGLVEKLAVMTDVHAVNANASKEEE